MESHIRLNWEAFVAEAVKRRKELKISQDRLAIIVGVSKPTVNAFEQGKLSLSLENAIKILKALGLTT